MRSKLVSVLVGLGTVASVVCRDIDIAAYRQKNIECMNKYRQKHQVQPLKVNQELTNMAQNWTQYLLASGKLEPQGTAGVGQNLFAYFSSADIPSAMDAACELWHSGEPKYDYQAGKYSRETGTFTQMVWKSSTDVGVGIANANGTYIIAANFKPAGNIIGAFLKNVFPPINSTG